MRTQRACWSSCHPAQAREWPTVGLRRRARPERGPDSGCVPEVSHPAGLPGRAPRDPSGGQRLDGRHRAHHRALPGTEPRGAAAGRVTSAERRDPGQLRCDRRVHRRRLRGEPRVASGHGRVVRQSGYRGRRGGDRRLPTGRRAVRDADTPLVPAEVPLAPGPAIRRLCQPGFSPSRLRPIGLLDPDLLHGESTDFCTRFLRQTGLSLGYAPRAVVFHRHRRTAWGLFRQQWNYGRGHASARPYRSEIPWGWRQSVSAYRGLGRATGRLMTAGLRYPVRRNTADLSFHYLDFVRRLAERLGSLRETLAGGYPGNVRRG